MGDSFRGSPTGSTFTAYGFTCGPIRARVKGVRNIFIFIIMCSASSKTVKNSCSASALQHVFRDKRNSGAVFTLRSKVTGKDYSYRITRYEYEGRWYTGVKVEVGYMNFIRLGNYYKGAIWKKSSRVETPSAVAIAWVLARVEEGKFDYLDTQIDTFHLGSCIVCGRPLTDAISISLGIGPVCRGER